MWKKKRTNIKPCQKLRQNKESSNAKNKKLTKSHQNTVWTRQKIHKPCFKHYNRYRLPNRVRQADPHIRTSNRDKFLSQKCTKFKSNEWASRLRRYCPLFTHNCKYCVQQIGSKLHLNLYKNINDWYLWISCSFKIPNLMKSGLLGERK